MPDLAPGPQAWAAFDAAALAFDRDVLIAGRSCRDALARACAWHRARGLKAAC